MRLLHLYSGNLYGGVETLLALLARRRVMCRAMDPHFALCFDGRLSAEIKQTGARLHRLGPVRLSRPLSVWRARRRLRQLLAATSFDVLVSHSPWINAVFGAVLRRQDVPLVQWLHNPLNDRWVDRWGSRTAPALVVCNSRFTASTTGSRFPWSEIDYLYPPVQTSPPAPAAARAARTAVRAELRTSDDAIVVVQASRLERWKGHRVHLDALGRLKGVGGWVAWLAGGAQRPTEARYLAELETQAATLGIAERVRFVGERQDVSRVLAAADIYCQPNIEPEPFGIVFVEALSAGLPVVSTDLGGPAEVVDASCGLLVPVGDGPALAGALRRLMADEAERRRLGCGGPARARQLCDPATQLTRLYELVARNIQRGT